MDRGLQSVRGDGPAPILAVTNWHESPSCLLQQLESYNIAFNGDIFHIVNINADFAARFWSDAEAQGLALRTALPNVAFVEPGVRTAWASVTQALVAGVQFALRENIDFDYVLWHTSADLMIKHDANLHVRNFHIGYGDYDWGVNLVETFPFEYVTAKRGRHKGRETIRLTDQDPSLEYYADMLAQDERLPGFYRSIGLAEVHKSRCEGSFFRRDLFFEIIYPLLMHVSVNDMETLDPVYPIEEILLAQCVEFYTARNPKLRRTSHLIFTPKREDQYATEEDIAFAMADTRIFGIKRFNEYSDSPIRRFARKALEESPRLAV